MVLQMRPGGTTSVAYSPARDVVHMLPDIVRNVADRLEEERFETLREWLDDKDVSPGDLGKACEAFIKFMATATDDPDETVHAALERVGWFDVKDEARIAYIFHIGAQLMGVMWTGIRDASVVNDDTLLDVKRLTGLGDKVQKALARPRWQRRIARCWARTRGWMIRLLQGKSS